MRGGGHPTLPPLRFFSEFERTENMRIASLVSLLGSFAFFSSGCGLISKTFEGTTRFSFDIDSKDAKYDSVNEFSPNSDEDVKNNKDKIKSGQIIAITIEISDIKNTNGAKYIGGQVDVKRSTQPDTSYITAAGRWDGIPLYAQDGSPAIGQIITLDLTPDTITKLRDLVFNLPPDNGSSDCTPCTMGRGMDGAAPSTCPASCLDFHINGMGYDYALDGAQWVQKETGPVQLAGDVVVKLKVVAGG
jgi:hypothetical protein